MIYRMNSTQYNILKQGGEGKLPKSHNQIITQLIYEQRRQQDYITEIVVYTDTIDRTKYKK